MRSLAVWKAAPKGSPASCSSWIMRLRSAARCAKAMAGRRAANHSTCCIFMRSQGGLPTRASKPPQRPPSSASLPSSQSGHRPGKASCQCRKRSSSASWRACSSRLPKRAAGGESSKAASPAAMARGSPKAPASQEPSANASSPVGCSQSRACSTERKRRRGAVPCSMSANRAEDCSASSISASESASKCRMGSAAASARRRGSSMNRAPPAASACSFALPTQQPNRLSPQRR